MGSAREQTNERDVRAALLDYLTRPGYRPMTQRQLLHRMHLAATERPPMRRVIRHLLREGELVRLSGGRLAAAAAGERRRVTGTLHRHPDGYGFVIADDGGQDIFVPPGALGRGITGDRVTVELSRDGRQGDGDGHRAAPRSGGRPRDEGARRGGRDGRRQGVVVAREKPRERNLLGVFVERGDGGIVRPLDPAQGDTLEVPAAFRHGASEGDVVGVRVVPAAREREHPDVKVVEVLGPLSDPATSVMAICRKYGLETEIPQGVVDAAERLPARVARTEAARRERFDDPAPVTIDGATARDFDDAVAVAALARGAFRLWVHIADVSHFVAPGDTLDAEARRRGTSVYFPERVLPMFPERLSNDLCSLRPGVDRLVQTAVLDIGPRGGVRSVRFADGVIRSAARLTYDQVAEVLAGADRVEGVPASVVSMLGVAGRLGAALARSRAARGSLDFDLPEPEILLDMEGATRGIVVRERNDAHRLIEELMIAANEAVARELERGDTPCVFRIHEAPDPTKIEALDDFVAGFGERLPHDHGEIEPRQLRGLIDRLAGRPEAAVVAQVALRSLQQARYDVSNAGHFGLASASYCHFTSPIRRYPDLLVHRLLRSRRRGQAPPHDEEELRELSASCSSLERNAEAAERELLSWKKVEFIADRVGESFDGVVTGVTRFGVFVQLTETLVEGLVHVANLGDDRFDFDEAGHALVGRRGGQRIRLGDRLPVRVTRVDRVLHRVDLMPEGELPTARATRGRGGRRRSSLHR